MVAIDSWDERSDRAQLILVGAVAIAFIVMGLVVVFNTVLYTENVASTGSVSEPRNAQEMKRVSEEGTRGLVERINTGYNWTSESDLNDSIEQNVTAYARNMTNVTAASSPAFVSFDYLGIDQMGAHVQHRDGSQFDTGPTASPNRNWTVVKPDSRTAEFNATIKVDSLGTPGGAGNADPFRVVFESASPGASYTVWVYREGPDSSDDVVIQTVSNESSPEVAYDSSTECPLGNSASNETVRIDFEDGVIRGYPSCSDELDLDSVIQPSQSRSVEFYNGTKAAGQFSLVVNDTDRVGDDVTDPSSISTLPPIDDETPYYTYALWSAEYKVTYQSSRTSFDDTYVIGVYNRSR